MPTNPASINISSLNGTNGFAAIGIDYDDRSGYSVASAGDVNGDGFCDIIIGAYGSDSFAGESYVIFGKAAGFTATLDLASLNGTNGFRIDGIGPGDRSGKSVGSAGDVNGDGFDDLLIGANSADQGEEDTVYVVFGKDTGFAASSDLSALNGTNGFRMDGIDAHSLNGRSVSSAGDINGDGCDDILIGDSGGDPGGDNNAGESYIVFGKAAGFATSIDLSALDGTIGFRIDGVDAGDNSGCSVSSAGDVNGDGFDDILIGANFASPSGDHDAGASYLIFGKAGGFSASFDLSTLNGANGFRIDGIDPNDVSGWCVSTAGDVNGDGFDDILVGALGASPGGDVLAGETYVIFGSNAPFTASLDLATLNGTNGFRLDGIDPFDSTGLSVSSAGDVNGDGFDDIIIGAHGGNPGGLQTAGESYVVFGRAGGFSASLDLSTLNGSDGFRIDGNNAFYESGRAVASAGDVNGDGFDDIVIGAYLANPGGDSRAGTSYVIFGRATAAITWTGDAVANTKFGGDYNDTFSGEAGNDKLYGSAGNDELHGGDNNDYLRGQAGNDNLYGDAGNDNLVGGVGSDDLQGGTGNDTYQADALDTLTEDFNSGIDRVYANASFVLGANFERLTLQTSSNINATGNSLGNLITGNNGSNILTGRIGADRMTGKAGSDSFHFAAGDSGQTASTMDKITDFAKGAVGVSDEFDFTSVLRTGGSAAAATTTQAAIIQATGLASFAAGSGSTLTDAVRDINARIDAVGNQAGDFALFQVNDTGDYYIFVSDGVAGVTDDDLLVQLTNVTTIGSINLTGGDLTILT